MSVKITGMEQMMNEISRRVKQVSEKDAGAAVQSGAEVVHQQMQKNFEQFADTGASKDEMKMSEVRTEGGNIKVFIYWEGPQQRYRLIHLNEKGYTRDGKRYMPRGVGAIARALRSSESVYFQRVRRKLG